MFVNERAVVVIPQLTDDHQGAAKHKKDF